MVRPKRGQTFGQRRGNAPRYFIEALYGGKWCEIASFDDEAEAHRNAIAITKQDRVDTRVSLKS